MRTITTSAALGLALGLVLTGSAAADPYRYGGEGDQQEQGWTPRGSYRATCTDIRVDDNELEANCRERDGDWRRSDLQNFRNCHGDIANDDGRLVCRREDDDDQGQAWTPRGSYRATCNNIRIDGNELEANCRERDGDSRQSDLPNFRECRGDIYNDDGSLKCRRDEDDNYGDRDRGDHRQDPGYGGGWTQDYGRITLYKDSDFRGSSRTFNRDVPDLHSYGFADTASSAYVQGGPWQLCTRTYYRGRCVTIRGTVNNFQYLGINDRTESLRRVR